MYERDPAAAKFIRGRALGVLASVREMQRKGLEGSIAKHRAATRREMAKALEVAIRARRPRGDDRWNRFAILAREAVSELKREEMRLDKRAGLTPLPARR